MESFLASICGGQTMVDISGINFQLEMATASNLALSGAISHSVTPWSASYQQSSSCNQQSSSCNQQSYSCNNTIKTTHLAHSENKTIKSNKLCELELCAHRLLRKVIKRCDANGGSNKSELVLLEHFVRFLISEISVCLKKLDERLEDCIVALQVVLDSTRYRSFSQPMAHPTASSWLRNLLPTIFCETKSHNKNHSNKNDRKLTWIDELIHPTMDLAVTDRKMDNSSTVVPSCMLSDWARAMWIAQQASSTCVHPWVEFYDTANDRWLAGRAIQLLIPDSTYTIDTEFDTEFYQPDVDVPWRGQEQDEDEWQKQSHIEWTFRLWSLLELQLHHASYDGCHASSSPSYFRFSRRIQPILLIQPIATSNLGPRLVLLSCAAPLGTVDTKLSTTEADQLHAPLQTALHLAISRKTNTPITSIIEQLWIKLIDRPTPSSASSSSSVPLTASTAVPSTAAVSVADPHAEGWRQGLECGSRVDLLPKGESSWCSATVVKKLIDMVLVQVDLTVDGRRITALGAAHENEWLPISSFRLAPHGQWKNYLAVGHEVDFLDHHPDRWQPAHVVKTAVCFVQLQLKGTTTGWVSRWSSRIARTHLMKHFYLELLSSRTLDICVRSLHPAHELFAHTHHSTVVDVVASHLLRSNPPCHNWERWDLLQPTEPLKKTLKKTLKVSDNSRVCGLYQVHRGDDRDGDGGGGGGGGGASNGDDEWRPSEDSRAWLWLVNEFGRHNGFPILCQVLQKTSSIATVLSVLDLVRNMTPRLALPFANAFLPSFVRLVVSAILRTDEHFNVNVRQVMEALREVGSVYDPFDLNDALRRDVYRLPFEVGILSSSAKQLPQEVTNIVFDFFFNSHRSTTRHTTQVPFSTWRCTQCTYEDNLRTAQNCTVCYYPRTITFLQVPPPPLPPLPPPLPLPYPPHPYLPASVVRRPHLSYADPSMMGALAKLSLALDDLKASRPSTSQPIMPNPVSSSSSSSSATAAATAALPQIDNDDAGTPANVVCHHCTANIPNPLRKQVLVCGVCLKHVLVCDIWTSRL
jgi:hypothetical protein